jgi:membrane protein
MYTTAAWEVFKQTAVRWMNHHPFRLAAALAYYTLFSVAPLLVVVLGIAGLVFGEQAVRGEIFGQLKILFGDQGANVIQTAVAAASVKSSGVIATTVGISTLLLGASAVFGELQDALNSIWDAKPSPTEGLWSVARKRLVSLSMVAVIGFLLLASLAISAALSAVATWLGGLLPVPAMLVETANFVVSLGVISLLFAAIFKVLPDVEIPWSDVWVGGAATSFLFTVGKALIGFYLGRSAVASAYGAASSLVLMLLWIYYSALILYFGAEFTRAYSVRVGSKTQGAPPPRLAAVPNEKRRRGTSR